MSTLFAAWLFAEYCVIKFLSECNVTVNVTFIALLRPCCFTFTLLVYEILILSKTINDMNFVRGELYFVSNATRNFNNLRTLQRFTLTKFWPFFFSTKVKFSGSCCEPVSPPRVLSCLFHPCHTGHRTKGIPHVEKTYYSALPRKAPCQIEV